MEEALWLGRLTECHWAYADLSIVSLEGLEKAVERCGVKCQIVSHEEIKVRYKTAGSMETLKNDLARTKWVLKAEVCPGENCVKVLTVRGRVTHAAIKAVMERCGFPEVQ
jgi:hypothetical protein